MDRPDVRSDAYEALWHALLSYDPELGDLSAFLCAKIRQSVIDGLRARHGRSESVRYRKGLVQRTFPIEDCHDLPTDHEWDPETIRFTGGEIERVVAALPAANKNMPLVTAMLLDGHTWEAAAEVVGMSPGALWSWHSHRLHLEARSPTVRHHTSDHPCAK